MVVIDSNIIIDHLRQKASTESILSRLLHQTKPAEVGISIITIQELFEGQSTKDKEIERLILGIIKPLAILQYSFEVAKKAGEIARDLDQPIDFADSAIAATAIVNDAEFLTLNKKDFAKIKNLRFASI